MRGWEGFGSSHRPRPLHPPGGDYLIRGRKVGGNWGVGGVRLGTQAPSIHLERGQEGDIMTKCQQWRYTQSRERVKALLRWCCVRVRVHRGRWLTHFLPRLNHLLRPHLFSTHQQLTHICGTSWQKISLNLFPPSSDLLELKPASVYK